MHNAIMLSVVKLIAEAAFFIPMLTVIMLSVVLPIVIILCVVSNCCRSTQRAKVSEAIVQSTLAKEY